MSQIKFIKSEFDIELNTVWNAGNIDGNVDLRIVEQETTSLNSLCLPGGYTKIKSIMVNWHIANTYYTKLLKN